MGNMFKKECSKYYRKHWKTKHFIFTRETYFEKILPLSRVGRAYKYSLTVFEKFGL